MGLCRKMDIRDETATENIGQLVSFFITAVERTESSETDRPEVTEVFYCREASLGQPIDIQPLDPRTRRRR